MVSLDPFAKVGVQICTSTTDLPDTLNALPAASRALDGSRGGKFSTPLSFLRLLLVKLHSPICHDATLERILTQIWTFDATLRYPLRCIAIVIKMLTTKETLPIYR
jgi:hypothetical protein